MKQPIIFFCLLAALVFGAHAEEQPLWRIEATGGTNSYVEYSEGGSAVGHNGVKFIGEHATVTADYARGNEQTGEVDAVGDVTIVGQDHIWRGTNVIYNFKTGEMQSGAFRTENPPVYISGQTLAGRTNEIYATTNAILTTDDFYKPTFKIRARRLVVFPNDHYEAHGATVMIGNVPVFYFPYYRRSFGRHRNNLVFVPGYRSLYGPFLLTTYNWEANDKLDGALHLDLRQTRGVGEGADFNYHLGKELGDGSARFYFTHDQRPNIDGITATIEPVGTIGHDRTWIRYSEKMEPETNLTAKVSLNYQSDPLVVRDFFEREYRKNVQPNSFAEVNKIWPNYSLDVMAQPRINDFWERVERLPDIKLTALRQQIGETPLFYEAESSAGYFQRRFATTDPFNSTNDFAAGRIDSFHQFVLPYTFFGWLNVTPRVGGRLTYYRNSWGPIETNGLDETRGVFNTGAEASFKASRVWREPENRFFDVNGLRHIIEPSVNYVFVPSPNTPPSQLPQFDYEVPSLRLLPIDYPEYNAIDSIDTQNVLRLTLRNKLQTKRKDGVENLVNWALYTDWRLDTQRDRTLTLMETNFGSRLPATPVTRRIHQERFANVFSDLDLKPRSWLTLNSQIRYDVENRRFNETFHQITAQPNNVWSASVSYRYLINNDTALINPVISQFRNGAVIPSQDIEVPGHKTFETSLHYRLNENWAARIGERFEARDGTLEEQQYTVYRDLRSWTAALTLRFRENRIGRKNDFTIAIVFSLKAFPRFGIGSDAEHPASLLGG